MKLRFNGKNKKTNYNKYIYIILFSLSFLCTFKLLFNEGSDAKSYLLGNILGEIGNKKLYSSAIIKENLSSPKYIIYNGLNKIVAKNNLSVFSNIETDYYDYDESKSEYVADPNPVKVDEPIVYLYNTHQLEEYDMTATYDYSVKPNVLIASYIMRENLNNLGINTIVETNNVKEYLNNHNMNYNDSYHATEYFARTAKEKYPSIKYLIDIHRDGVGKDATYVEINDKPYARILLVTGMEHTKKENNTGFAEKLNEIIEEKYDGLSRGILKKTEEPIYGVYNPNLDGKSVLIEVGGTENKIEEVNNTMEALAECLSILIKGEQWKRKRKTQYL